MYIAVSVLAILFGLLHILAAAVQLKAGDAAARSSSVVMICGGLALLGAAVGQLAGAPGYWDSLAAAAGGVLICCAAVLNGKRAGKLHPGHHVVRGALAVLLVVGFALW